MYTSKELENFITEPREYIDVEIAVELAKQLLQEKKVNKELHFIIDEMSNTSWGIL
jgi:hypothetical protein